MIKIPDFPKRSYQGGLAKARDGKWFDSSGHDLKSGACYAALSPTRVGASQALLTAARYRHASSFASDEAERQGQDGDHPASHSTSPTWVPFTKGKALAGLRHEERD